MKRLLASLVAVTPLALLSAPSLAGIYNASTDAGDVTIQEGAVTGAANNLIVADQLAGTYDENFSVTNPATGAFNTLAVFYAGSWTNNTVPVGSQLNFPEEGIGGELVGRGYRLYALFQSDGFFSVGPDGVISFSGANGTLELWADPLQNTDVTLPLPVLDTYSIADITVGDDGDDLLLGTASLLTVGAGSANPNDVAEGNFELIFGDWALANPNGLMYFAGPRPFYMVLDLNGNFQEFDPVNETDVEIRGSVANAFFVKVPEPATLGLMSIGLLGMGFGMRRRKT